MSLQFSSIFTVILSLISVLSFGQNKKAEKLLIEGYQYQTSGNIEDALERYEKAYDIAPDDLTVNYYMASAYYELGRSKYTYKHSKVLLGKGGEYEEQGYIFNGSALSALDSLNEALKVFYDGATKYPNNYTLHYNLAVTAWFTDQMRISYESAQNTLRLYPVHGMANNLLGQITYNKHKTYSLLAFAYNLMITDTDEHSKGIKDMVVNILEGGNNLEIGQLKEMVDKYSPETSTSEAEALKKADELLAQTQQSCKAAGKTDDYGLFVKNFTNYITGLGELKKKYELSGFWWDTHVTFFNELIEAGYGEVLAYTITRSASDGKAEAWLQNNMTDFNAMYKWLEDYYNEK